MLRIFPLVDWFNGIVMIGVFGVVVLILIGVLVVFMNSGKK